MAPWNGTGTFNTAITFVPNTPATAEDQNTQDNDIAAGITNTMARDGQNAASANISLGGNKLINVANGTGTTDGAAYGQLTTLLPPGIVLPTAGSVVPAGYLLCDGTAYSRTTYANLYAAIGTTYGVGDGVTTFNVPNLSGRVIAGVDLIGSVLSSFSINHGSAAAPGGFGGTQGVALTADQLATHNHIATVTDPGHTHGINDPGHVHSESSVASGIGIQPGTGIGVVGDFTGTSVTGITVQSAVTGISVSNSLTGSGNPHLNVQPTMVMNYLIKT